MAEFKGYLLKIEGKIFPNKYIQDYQATPDQVQDKDSYQDMTGKLHREVLPHTRSKIEFQTPPLNLAEIEDFLSYFSGRTIKHEMEIEYWNNETLEYAVGTFYWPNISYKIHYIKENDILHKPFRVALIEY